MNLNVTFKENNASFDAGFSDIKMADLGNYYNKQETDEAIKIAIDNVELLEGPAGPVGPRGPAGVDGKDGVSVTHSWRGTTLTVTSASGTSSADLRGADGRDGYTPRKNIDYFDGKNGVDGSDGFSPVASVVQTANGATITITDKSGTTTARVSNGSDGKDGVDGVAGPAGYTPVKGKDYYTEEEKAEIVREVIASVKEENTEEWVFELEDGSTVTKTVVIV